MTDLEEYKQYKKAKLIVKDIEIILPYLAGIKKTLANYYKYVPVKNVFTSIVDNQAILNAALKKYKKIIDKHES